MIQMVLKELFFSKKKNTKNRPAAGPQTPVCDTFGLNKFSHHVSQLRQFWKLLVQVLFLQQNPGYMPTQGLTSDPPFYDIFVP